MYVHKEPVPVGLGKSRLGLVLQFISVWLDK